MQKLASTVYRFITANLKQKEFMGILHSKRTLSFLFILGGAGTTFTGCVSLLPRQRPVTETVFRGSMEHVWMAAEKALAGYPISESNVDSGVLKTDYLRGPSCWRPPNQTEKFSAGIRCSLTLQMVKIPHSGVRVRVNKSLQMVRDFISEPEDLDSDGLEETMILYRIDREITIMKELNSPHKS